MCVQTVCMCGFCVNVSLPGKAVIWQGVDPTFGPFKYGLSHPAMEFLPSKKFPQTISTITAPAQTASYTKWIKQG